MTVKIVPRAKLHEVLALLKSRGIFLTDDGIKHLEKRLEEEPISKTTLDKSKKFLKNPIMKNVIDRAFVRRSQRIQRIIDSNPLLQLINERKRNVREEKPPLNLPMPDFLRKAFHDEIRWQPFFPFMYIPPAGQIIKIVETANPDLPYIAFLVPENGINYLYSTRRKIDIEKIPNAKYYRLKDGVFQYEIDEIKNLEKGYYDFIMMYHK
ncbi:hypothetical protein IID62_07705 [candidate division KSB1 bacterium]|nr:hypothetical protein [candidate division KSB1 bacterium]